jgi:small-conductance mechanosensitive channel
VLAVPSVDLDQLDPTLSAWDIILALLILIVAWIVSRAAGRAVHSVTRRLEGIPPEIAVLAARVVRSFFIVLGIGMALTALGADMQPVLAATLVVAVAAALSLRGIAENFAAGVVLQTSRPINAGDVVDIKGYTGTVREINGRAVVIETFDGAVVHVPNADTLDSAIVNRSTTAGRRSSVEARVGRERMVVEQLLTTVGAITRGVEGVLTEPPVATSLTAVDESRTTVLVTFWHDPSRSAEVSSDVVAALAAALTEIDPAASVVALPLPAPAPPPPTTTPTR